MSESPRAMKTSVLLRRFLPYYKPYVGVMALDLGCAALTTVCELVLPLIVREITSRASGAGVPLTVAFVLKVGLLYLVLRAVDAAANYFMASVGHVTGTRIEADMRSDLFSHLMDLSFSYYSNTKIGQLMARITSDLFEVTEFSHHCPEELVIAAIKITVAFVILIGVNVPLTLVLFAMVPLMIVCCRVFNVRMRRSFQESRHQVGEINAQVEDSLLGIRVVKSFANEDMERAKFAENNRRFIAIKKQTYRHMAGFSTTTRAFDGLMYIVVVVLGALLLIDGRIAAPDYIAYLLYVSTLIATIRRIVEYTEQFQRGMTGIERFQQIMDAPVEIRNLPDAVPLTDVRGDIDFEDVSFHYEDDAHTVLTHLNLSIRAGERVALIGPSGGGKTTLVNLLPRFYNLSGGVIRVDGRDVRDFTLASLRGAIGVVQQDVYLFSGTVLDNIRYGKPDATLEQVEEAAKRAGAHAFIRALPKGYDTFIGERGVKLSGGQKQRLSIARVFLKDPPILILDEATSALDNESEREVQRSLEALSHGRTTFTIAHRLTTIRGADRIWVLTGEGIAEHGTHQELLARGGLYSRYWRMYAEGQT